MYVCMYIILNVSNDIERTKWNRLQVCRNITLKYNVSG